MGFDSSGHSIKRQIMSKQEELKEGEHASTGKWTAVGLVIVIVIVAVVIAVIHPSISDVELGLFIITILLFFITAYQAKLTRQNVEAAKKMIELQAEPLVFIDANWEDRFWPDGRQHLVLKVSIRNRGGGPARDVKIVKVKDDFPVGMDVKKFSELEIVNDEIKELAPGQDMLLARLLDGGSWRKCPPSEIFFEYKTISGKTKPASSIIPFPALATVYESPAYHMK